LKDSKERKRCQDLGKAERIAHRQKLKKVKTLATPRGLHT